MASILVIDDEHPIRDILRKLLEREGHAVSEAPDGKTALRMFAGDPADVVITDIYMPEMDGIEFLMRVREAHPEVRIIALSGGGFLDKENVLKAASNLGAVAVLEKPFSLAEVLAAVEKALEDD